MTIAIAGQPVTRGVTSVAMLCGALACGSSSPTAPSDAGSSSTTLTPVAQTAEWPISTVDAEGLDTVRLTDAVNRIRRREYGRIHSLLVARNDRLARDRQHRRELERAVGGAGADSLRPYSAGGALVTLHHTGDVHGQAVLSEASEENESASWLP
jgi:hypothetical protein